ncbi:MAG: hypothetical protein AMS21_00635, partial [Gemmatimonas sp. SG8_38_2]
MSKEPGIILSDQHGVNPTLLKCEWCGKDTGTIALVGKQHYYICKTCSFKHIGRPKYGHCVKCAAQGINSKVYKGNEFDGSIDHVRMGLCDECDAKREEQAA